jgi:hypothetical protein
LIKKILIALIVVPLLSFWVAFQYGPSYFTSRFIDTFSEEEITKEFISYMTQVNGVKKIQIAELNQLEVLSQESRKKILWKRFELPSVVVALEIPVSYTYTLDLEKPWKFNQSGDVMQIIAPALEFNSPAPNVSEMRFRLEKQSLFRDEEPTKQRLLKELTPYLERRAQAQVSLVRETARRELEGLVKDFMNRQKDQNLRVEVLFTDEMNENQPLID